MTRVTGLHVCSNNQALAGKRDVRCPCRLESCTSAGAEALAHVWRRFNAHEQAGLERYLKQRQQVEERNGTEKQRR